MRLPSAELNPAPKGALQERIDHRNEISKIQRNYRPGGRAAAAANASVRAELPPGLAAAPSDPAADHLAHHLPLRTDVRRADRIP